MTQTLFSSTTTPLTPPTMEEDRLSWLRLFRSKRVGVATFFKLINEYGTAGEALSALPEIARNSGNKEYDPCSQQQAEAEFRAARKSGARLICYGDREYPRLLSHIEDAPPLMWAIGRVELLDTPLIALVGARNASSLGERMARRLAKELGEAGFTIVSGLARGIDTAAHRASLKTGTIAVLGGGVDVVYPRENATLQESIAAEGLLLSEQPMGLAPMARHFPRRNRIVSGVSHGLVVVEAAARSGSLITARNAAEQGREVMAVPGHPFDGRASGCNMLLRDGATLIRGHEDVLEALTTVASNPAAPRGVSTKEEGPYLEVESMATPEPHPTQQPETADSVEASILSRVGPNQIQEDALIRDLGVSAQRMATALTNLELDGAIQRHPGGLVSRVSP